MIDPIIHKQIQELAEIEATNINDRFQQSNKIAEAHILICLLSFKSFLELQDGKFINGMNLTYRLFVVELLKRINSNCRDFALKTILTMRPSCK